MARWDVVASLLKDPQIGAEIGVKGGPFIASLLGRFPSLHMYAVDPWRAQPGANEDYERWDFTAIYNEYLERTKAFRKRIKEIRHFSIEAATLIQDGSLDFVFIDAQHDYESVRNDIEAWLPKIKKGGLICGHDHDNNFPGVRQAVRENFGTDYSVCDHAVWYCRC